MSNRPQVLADVECYIDYFKVRFKRRDNRKVVREFRMYQGLLGGEKSTQRLDVDAIREILRKFTVITFNGNNYDIPMITLALSGATCKQLKMASDQIITRGLKSWQFYRRYEINELRFIDHVDLIEPAPGVMIGLKMYGARLHSKRLQDLPIDPSASTSPEQREVLSIYCDNDLETTGDLADAIWDRIELRDRLGAMYGMDFRSKSDAQIGEAILISQSEAELKCKIERPDIDDRVFSYKPPKFIKFSTPEMNEVFERMCSAEYSLVNGEVKMPKTLEGYVVNFRGKNYSLGIGGLHSQESKIHHKAKDGYRIWDYDVASYYPNIILLCKLFPLHIGPAFLRVYRQIVNLRLQAKRTGDKVTNEGLKIAINGSYGKFGSKYSRIFSPELMIQVTVTGQLGLLMLVERIEEAGIEVISANTDGIVSKPHESDVETLHGIIRQWCEETGFEMEGTEYSQVMSRDVNNYVAIKTGHETVVEPGENGLKTSKKFDQRGRNKVKTKGVFESMSLKKSPVAQISVDAAIKHLVEGVSILNTIRSCQDVRKFIVVRGVTGGGTWNGDYLGKTVRWVYATNGAPILTKKKGDKVATSDGALPLMELPDKLPKTLDYMKYYDLSVNLLLKAGFKFEDDDL